MIQELIEQITILVQIPLKLFSGLPTLHVEFTFTSHIYVKVKKTKQKWGSRNTMTVVLYRKCFDLRTEVMIDRVHVRYLIFREL